MGLKLQAIFLAPCQLPCKISLAYLGSHPRVSHGEPYTFQGCHLERQQPSTAKTLTIESPNNETDITRYPHTPLTVMHNPLRSPHHIQGGMCKFAKHSFLLQCNVSIWCPSRYWGLSLSLERRLGLGTSHAQQREDGEKRNRVRHVGDAVSGICHCSSVGFSLLLSLFEWLVVYLGRQPCSSRLLVRCVSCEPVLG